MAFASHQTGWTGVIATLMHIFGAVTPEAFLEGGRLATFGSIAQSAGPRPATGDAPASMPVAPVVSGSTATG